ncbi:hypothetical protein F4779DRAFT_612121 [Xylariaceae sp. FL0662B]|nr:hypothetical protein F4779DRAFT_612121 [Xylariaceae sp. FL0662B]
MDRIFSYLWRAFLFIVLRSCSVLGQVTVTITNDPTITAAPSEGTPFEGYYIIGTKTTPLYCASNSVFVTWANYAGCCPSKSTSCALATACKGNTVMSDNGKTSACGTQQCRSLKIFPTYPAEGTAVTMPFCAGIWEADTLYHAIPMTSALTMPLAISGSGYSNAMPTGAMSAPAAAATASNAPSTNYGAIAGAIVGTVAVTGLVLAGFWYGRRRTRAKRRLEAQSGHFSGSDWTAASRMYKQLPHSYSRSSELNSWYRPPPEQPMRELHGYGYCHRGRSTPDRERRFPRAHIRASPSGTGRPSPPPRSRTMPESSRQQDWRFPTSPLVRSISKPSAAAPRKPERVVARSRSVADAGVSPRSTPGARGPELGKSTLSHR